MSLYPLPCSRTKLSCRNILLGKKFRVKNCGPAEQWTVRHCMGNRVKALELLYGSQDLVFNKLGLEVPGSWSSPVKNLTTDSIKRKFGFALGNCFLQRQRSHVSRYIGTELGDSGRVMPGYLWPEPPRSQSASWMPDCCGSSSSTSEYLKVCCQRV